MYRLNKVPTFKELPAINKKCKAVLWDMDGTIMQTEFLHAQASYNILNKYHTKDELKAKSIDLDKTDEICMGATDQQIFQKLSDLGFLRSKPLNELMDEKYACLVDLLKSVPADKIIKHEIRQLIKSIKESSIQQVVVTSSEKDITQALLSFLGLMDHFSFIITREDTKENKPSPMPYVTAMSKLKLDPSEVIIFEDSKVGVAAAKASQATYREVTWYNV